MGAAPGAWSQVLVKQVNARIDTRKKIQQNELTSIYKPNPDLKCGIVIALDRSPIFEIPGVHIIDDWNLTEETTKDCNKRLEDLLNRLKIDKVDGILSDMCPNVTGMKSIDHSG
jgi:23S rRNA U2552 (ribose-2'-O)-methylase RlmE/FtsJ